MTRLIPARPSHGARRSICVALFSATALFLFSSRGALGAAADSTEGGRVTLNFNPDWKFLKDDPAGAQAVSFDDRAWANISTPHTYNDIDTFDNWSTPGHRGEQIQWSGRTWYRKTFTLPAALKGKKVFIEFEAARQIAEVYLNGQLLGVAKTGFTPFGFDLTPQLKFGEANVLAVMVDNRFMRDPLDPATIAELAKLDGTDAAAAKLSSTENPNLGELSKKVNESIPDNLDQLAADQIPWNNPHWHPAHGGLYRDVRLYVTDPLHISLPLYSFLETAGPYVYSSNVTDASAQVTLEVPAQNARATSETVELQAEFFDAEGKSVLVLKQTESMAAGVNTLFKVSGAIAHPRLWEPAYPHLYRVVCALRVKGRIIDTSEIPLGIRTVRWEVASGFYINGNHLKLHGWGQKPTDEWAGLGAAQPDWLHFKTLELMKAAGGNFVRWGHSATSPASIRAGDRLGIIALQPGTDGESDTVGAAWKLRAMAFRDTIIYFRNNPSILIWEGGNQKVTREHAQELRGLMDRYDPHGDRAYAHRRADAITAEFMDIGIGTEGGREIARLPVVEGEYDREESPRRVWDNASPPNFGYPEAKGMIYQLTSEQYAINQIGPQYLKKLGAPEHSGGANWIFSDTTSGGRVPAEVARAGGEVDGVRLPKEAYYVVATMFRDDPQVHLIGHWTYPAGTKKTMYVASNGDEVELFVNGASLGRKPSDPGVRYLFTFPEVSWQPGEIKAVAYRAGAVIATDSKRTAGAPVALKLTAITGPGGLRADGSDVVLIDVEAVDAKGERCPTFQQRVDFVTEGPGVWRGGYNSGKVHSTNNPFLDLEAGINRVAVRSTRQAGAITVRATAQGLKPGSVTVSAQAFPAVGGVTPIEPAMPGVKLAAQMPAHALLVASAALAPAKSTAAAKATVMPGRFVQALGYSGPAATIVHVERNAREGKNVYADRNYAFTALPAEFEGADWIQAADADARYNAVDLIELAAAGGTTVSVAHDERAGVPAWLTRLFKPTGLTLTVNGRPMKVFQRPVAKDESITLGSNSDEARPIAANMYVVLINGAENK